MDSTMQMVVNETANIKKIILIIGLTNGSHLTLIFYKPKLKLNSSNKSIEGQKYGTKIFSALDRAIIVISKSTS